MATTQPSGQADWDFAGGSSTGHNFNNWEMALNRGKVVVNGNENLSFGDGHTQVQQNPFAGVSRDMAIARNRFEEVAGGKPPINADVNALRPLAKDADGDGIADTGLKTTPVLTPNSIDFYAGAKISRTGKYDVGGRGVSVNGANNYVGGTNVTGGKLEVDQKARGQFGFEADTTVTDMHGAQQLGPKFKGQSPGLRGYYFAPYALSDNKTATESSREEVAQQITNGDKIELRNRVADRSGGNAQIGGELAELGTDQTGKPIKQADAIATPQSTPGQEGNAPAQQNPPTTPAQPTVQPPADSQPAPTTQAIVRKVIRNGDITFEVDSFDSSTLTITKIVNEEGGYVATTNSEKLPNGKVKGTIVVRIPPDHLDTLVLKLRALGDLQEPEPDRGGCDQAIHRHRVRASRRTGDAGAAAQHHQELARPD